MKSTRKVCSWLRVGYWIWRKGSRLCAYYPFGVIVFSQLNDCIMGTLNDVITNDFADFVVLVKYSVVCEELTYLFVNW